MLAPGAQEWLYDFKANLLRDAADARAMQRELGPRVPYFDPIFSHQPSTYADFLTLLHDRGMLQWTRAPKSGPTFGLFFVRKKDDKIRLIFDTRVCNHSFKSPLIN